ncbi:MAG: glycosyltransferase family 39 protein [Patescibacteria group bacterium]|nr:glycosyltransferase family 39 protein [Patescibacteria group bacterium]MDE2589030.1 glycosyltransferase family 39 protein [Patescibacteria group bacterium]
MATIPFILPNFTPFSKEETQTNFPTFNIDFIFIPWHYYHMRSNHTSQQVLQKKFLTLFQFLKQHRFTILFCFLLILQIFLRTYQLFERASFGWDQIDSAWAAKSILVDKQYFINGPVAKLNSGIYLGPLYFYLITPFYFFTNLDPIASPIFQAVLSVFSLFVIYFVTKKIFNSSVALVASAISIFSLSIMNADRIQSAFYLIVPISYLIFFALVSVVKGKTAYIPFLALFLGLSLQVDFISVFYPVIILLCLPFFPRNKQTLKYSGIGIVILLLLILPSLIGIFTKHTSSGSFAALFHSSYHGVHLTRILQLFHDAFISFGEILQFNILAPFACLLPITFGIVYYIKTPTKQTLIFFYIIGLFIFVPWLILSTYKGELTDYYFALPKDLAIAMLAFLTVYLVEKKNMIFKLIPILFWGIYVYTSLTTFFIPSKGNLLDYEKQAKIDFKNKTIIPFSKYNAEIYLYEVYSHKGK